MSVKLINQKNESEEKLRVNVKDNGIGINKAKEQSHMSQKRKFFGIEATENRIRILYKNNSVKIDTKDISNDTQSGTQVSIQFPYLID